MENDRQYELGMSQDNPQPARGELMAKYSRTLRRILGRVFLSALLFAAMLGGPLVILIILSSRFAG